MSRRDKGCVTTGIMMLSPARSVGTESYETTVVRSGGARRAPRQFFQFLVSNRLTSHSSQSKLMPDGRTLACRGGARGAVWYSQNIERWQKQGSEEGIKSGGEKLGEISEKFAWQGGKRRGEISREICLAEKRNYLQEICLCFKRNPDLPQDDAGPVIGVHRLLQHRGRGGVTSLSAASHGSVTLSPGASGKMEKETQPLGVRPT